MITKFKIFENNNIPQDKYDLVDLFSQEFIEKYYLEHYNADAKEAALHLNLWGFVDKNKVKEGLIEDLSKETYISDNKFKKEDFINYIKDNISIFKEELDNYISDKNLKKLVNYDDAFINMNKRELIEIIENENKEYDFKKDYFEDLYWHSDAEEVLMDIHGKNAAQNIENLYDYLYHYIDDNELIDYYLEHMDFDDKYNYLANDIPYNINLQKELIKKDPNTVIALFDIIDDSQASVGETYEFQKLYIEQTDKDIADTLKKINDKFGLDNKIKKEYSEYMYKISSGKYNI